MTIVNAHSQGCLLTFLIELRKLNIKNFLKIILSHNDIRESEHNVMETSDSLHVQSTGQKVLC